MIAIVDYGVGNLFSLRSSLEALGLAAEVTGEADRLRSADRIILPGVGAFADAKAKLDATGLVPVLREEAARKPLLGICLGMQLLFDRSFEYGEHPGLGFVPGEVADLRQALDDPALKVPHMGWNSLTPAKESLLLDGLPADPYVYFVHSYYVPYEGDPGFQGATAEYGVSFTAAVQKDNLFATQFHPEKSGEVGLQMLRNFAAI